jgi:AcrR family transcriptional regulator
MSIAYDETGRVDQKRRTRQALVDAARALVAEGLTPTVEEAATAARISRTTAYRYFPSQRDLLASAFPEIEASSMLPTDASQDPADRLRLVVEAVTDAVVRREAQQRTMLRLSLEASAEERSRLILRQGRVIPWLEEALRPLKGSVPQRNLRRLVLAVRATIGIESYVWLTDVAGLSSEEAVATMRWSAAALLQQTLHELAERKQVARRRPRQARH